MFRKWEKANSSVKITFNFFPPLKLSFSFLMILSFTYVQFSFASHQHAKNISGYSCFHDFWVVIMVDIYVASFMPSYKSVHLLIFLCSCFHLIQIIMLRLNFIYHFSPYTRQHTYQKMRVICRVGLKFHLQATNSSPVMNYQTSF